MQHENLSLLIILNQHTSSHNYAYIYVQCFILVFIMIALRLGFHA